MKEKENSMYSDLCRFVEETIQNIDDVNIWLRTEYAFLKRMENPNTIKLTLPYEGERLLEPLLKLSELAANKIRTVNDILNREEVPHE